MGKRRRRSVTPSIFLNTPRPDALDSSLLENLDGDGETRESHGTDRLTTLRPHLLIALPSFHFTILINDPSRFKASLLVGSFSACRSARAAITEYWA
ncbi:hypothetical protein E2C01_032948 [Portunus trituberculatus]|uniref:Uncharacterized protein n=1 Tax=Portunus trituberculatus TaxID=210409 RepID=A0A5B7F2V6_PORTR|nr:hypothetical protein [Portunus trituberculatus]